MKKIMNFVSKEFEETFYYEKPLGARCGAEGTRITLWAPTAEEVYLHLYAAGKGGDPKESVAMQKESKGVWTYTSARNLDGWYYDFDVTGDGFTRRTADPYAVACGVIGKRSMILDLTRTVPEGWE